MIIEASTTSITTSFFKIIWNKFIINQFHFLQNNNNFAYFCYNQIEQITSNFYY